jgi:glyoxylase-like metal-dependent hydrolase (beta-lactamase superfamily II)
MLERETRPPSVQTGGPSLRPPDPTGPAQTGTGDPQLSDVAEGVINVRLGGRFGPGPAVNMFVLRTAQGPVLIDAGLNGPASLDALTRSLAQAGFTISELRAILLTHTHIDHIGLVATLKQQSDAWVGMHPAEAVDLAQFPRDPEGMTAMARKLLAVGGARLDDDAEGTWFYGRADPMVQALTVDAVTMDRALEHGDELDFGDRRLEVILTAGHAPGHLCFWDRERRHLFTGDLLLAGPESLPWMGPTPHDPLAQFLDSVARVSELPAALVLPGHGAPASSITPLARARHMTIETFLGQVSASLQRRGVASPWEVSLDVSDEPSLSRSFARRAMSVGQVMYGLRALEARGLAQTDGRRWRFTPGQALPVAG